MISAAEGRQRSRVSGTTGIVAAICLVLAAIGGLATLARNDATNSTLFGDPRDPPERRSSALATADENGEPSKPTDAEPSQLPNIPEVSSMPEPPPSQADSNLQQPASVLDAGVAPDKDDAGVAPDEDDAGVAPDEDDGTEPDNDELPPDEDAATLEESVVAEAATPCGTTQCAPGQVCCNASCGTCVQPGETCSQYACGQLPIPASALCGPSTCNVGQVCCNASCGTCVQPGQTCDEQPCDREIVQPFSVMCGMATCNSGFVCCNPSCGTCALPGQPCSHQPCD